MSRSSLKGPGGQAVQRPRKDLMAQFRLDMVVHVGVIVDAACWVMPPSWDSRPQVGTNFDFLALPQVSRNLPSSPTCYRPALHTASAALSDKKMVAVKLQDTRRFLLPTSPVLYAAIPSPRVFWLEKPFHLSTKEVGPMLQNASSDFST
jgi:hypothetical protein